jgi:arsenate reductase (thioredoxin)
MSIYRAESAGAEPADGVHPAVVEVMRELGIDLSGIRPKRLTLEMQLHADWAITLACGGKCPYVPSIVEDWDVADPAGRPIEEVRRIRDEIEERVKGLAHDRIEEIREDRRQHQMRMAQLVPGLVVEFGDRLEDEGSARSRTRSSTSTRRFQSGLRDDARQSQGPGDPQRRPPAPVA